MPMDERFGPDGKAAQRREMTGAASAAAKDHGLVDIAVIGGGINGAGIARDAAGRVSRFCSAKGRSREGTSSRSASWFTTGCAISNITSSVWCAKR